MRSATAYTHVTADGTTVLVAADTRGHLHRVVIGDPGTAGTVTLQRPSGGAVISAVDLATVKGPVLEFDLDLAVGGLEVVAAAFAGTPSVTVIYEG